MNGQIALNINGNNVTVIGGAYRAKPESVVGVKLAEEIDLPCAVDLPIADFSIPDEKDTQIALAKTIALLKKHRVVYVGCMGGFGRTGLFLSLLVKVLAGHEMATMMIKRPEGGMLPDELADRYYNPIEWVRGMYVPSAVETPAQYGFVTEFNIRLLSNVARFL